MSYRLFAVIALFSLHHTDARAQTVIHEVHGAPADQFGSAVASPGDVDLDGYPDFAVAAKERRGGAGAVDLFSGRTGTLLRTLTDGPSNHLGRILLRAGDIDGDGHGDMWVGSDREVLGYSGRTGNVLWRFPSADFLAAAGDVDRDGRADLLAGMGDAGGSGLVAVLSGRTGAVVWSHVAVGQRLLASGPAGDIDGDGHDDVVLTVSDPSGYPRLLQVRSGRTTSVLRSAQVDPYLNVGVAVGTVGDHDHDGRDDYFVVQERLTPPPTGVVGLVTLLSGATGTTLDTYEGYVYCNRYSMCVITRVLTGVGAVGDFDGDGMLDPLFVVDGNQEGRTRAGTPIFVPSDVAAAAGDVDRDGREDLVVGLPALGLVRVQRVPAAARLSPPGYVPRIGSAPGVTRIGDLDGDGHDDFAFTGLGYTAFGNSNRCDLRSGSDAHVLASFTGSIGFATVIQAASAGDVDGDGGLDVVVGWNSGGGPPDEHHAELLRNGGQQLFRFDHIDVTYGIGVAGGSDWNADAVPDVFVAGLTFTEVRSGRDGSLLRTIAAGGNRLVVVGDLDADGQGDLAIGDSIFSSRNAQLIWTLAAAPTPAGDVDGDRHADLWLAEAAGPTLVSGRTRNALRVLPWPRGNRGLVLASGADWDGDGTGDLVVGLPTALLSGLAVVVSGTDGRELHVTEGDRRGDGLGATAALLAAPPGSRPSLVVSATNGGPLCTGYAVHVRDDADAGGAATHGLGCGGVLGLPRLRWIGRPRLGLASAYTVAHAAPSAAAAFALGGSEDRWLGLSLPLPLAPLGLPPCHLFTALDVLVPAVTDGGGTATLPLQVPNLQALVGARLFAQTVHADPTANATGLSFSNAVRLVVAR